MEIVSQTFTNCEVKNSPISIAFLKDQGFTHIDEEWWQYNDQHCRLIHNLKGELLLEFPLVKGSRLNFIACRLEDDVNKIIKLFH